MFLIPLPKEFRDPGLWAKKLESSRAPKTEQLGLQGSFVSLQGSN